MKLSQYIFYIPKPTQCILRLWYFLAVSFSLNWPTENVNFCLFSFIKVNIWLTQKIIFIKNCHCYFIVLVKQLKKTKREKKIRSVFQSLVSFTYQNNEIKKNVTNKLLQISTSSLFLFHRLVSKIYVIISWLAPLKSHIFSQKIFENFKQIRTKCSLKNNLMTALRVSIGFYIAA